MKNAANWSESICSGGIIESNALFRMVKRVHQQKCKELKKMFHPIPMVSLGTARSSENSTKTSRRPVKCRYVTELQYWSGSLRFAWCNGAGYLIMDGAAKLTASGGQSDPPRGGPSSPIRRPPPSRTGQRPSRG